eukprot:TRINITY_DN1413_c0_g3_i6.p1 TRINITY_DN1413_c0_g3~~TRINITY_DN1413_c0_g3_i6.p1  ORF type:complete len:596 (-),score=74.99 TRINITY_DN1413_c0_g3_i6:582-2369(-)
MKPPSPQDMLPSPLILDFFSTFKLWKWFATVFWYLVFVHFMFTLVVIGSSSFFTFQTFIGYAFTVTFSILFLLLSKWSAVFMNDVDPSPIAILLNFFSGYKIVYVIWGSLSSLFMSYGLLLAYNYSKIRDLFFLCSEGTCVNGDGFYVLGFTFFLGLVYTLRAIKEEENVISFPPISQPRLARFRDSHLSEIFYFSSYFPGLLLFVYVIGEHVIRFLFSESIVHRILKWFFKGLIDGIGTREHVIDFSVWFQMLFIGMLVSSFFRFAHHIIQVQFSSGVSFYLPEYSNTNFVNEALLHGLQSDYWVRCLATLDFYQLAFFDPQRRRLIYRDTKLGAWSRILEDVLKKMQILEDNITYVNQIYDEKTKTDKDPAKYSVTSLWFQLIVPYSLRTLFDKDEKQTPNDLYSIYKKTDIKPIYATRTPQNEEKKLPKLGNSQALDEILKGTGWYRSPKTLTRIVFSDTDKLIILLRSISEMTVRSKTEDSIGIVQNCDTVPRLLFHMVKLLIVIEENVKKSSPTKTITLNEKLIHTPKRLNTTEIEITSPQIILPQTYSLALTLHQCIHSIIDTYRDNMGYFDLDPSIKERVRKHINFEE